LKEPLVIKSVKPLSFSSTLRTVAVDQLDTLDLGGVSYFIVDGGHPQDALELLAFIRSQISQDVYLKPVVLVRGTLELPRLLEQATDGVLLESELQDSRRVNNWAAKLESVNAKIERLRAITTGQANLAFRILRFVFTRGEKLTPVLSAENRVGYIYPKLAPFFSTEDTGQFEILEYLESQRLLNGEFLNKSYNCTHCGCAFLNFYQVCPECGSSDLAEEELIHHFKCAYVGELSDFVQGEKLVCPKCNSTLKHVGADYDKASAVYRCNVCRAVSQEPDVMTVCYNCQRETEPENQVVREVKSYTITSVGTNAALYGVDSLLQNILKSSLDAVSYEVFKRYVSIEKKRIERYKLSSSSLALLQFNGIDEIYKKMGARAAEIFKEVRTAFQEQFRDSDLFCVKDENIFLILFTETTTENAEIAVNRVENRIAELLHTNLEIESKLTANTESVHAEIDVDVSVERLLQRNAS